MKDLVSVVIPTHNREKTICRAIKSALNQSYKDIEVVVVDDFSEDKTTEVVNAEFGNNPRVVYHRLKRNLGACAARNKGVQLSKGKYVAFLDSDDEFLPEKISMQIECMRKYNVSLCATDYTLINENGNSVIVKTRSGSNDQVYKELLYCNFITTGTLIGYKKCFVDITFDESLPRYQDWDIVLRLIKKYPIYILQRSTLMQYTQSVSISTSTNHTKTLNALSVVYDKNLIGFQSDKKAYSQIHWLMGLHSLFVDGTNPYRHLLKGALSNGINLKRLIIVFISLFSKRSINKYM